MAFINSKAFRFPPKPASASATIGGIEALVGIHLARVIGISSHLPAAHVNSFKSRLDLLHGLISGKRAEGIDVRAVVKQLPQTLSSEPGERVFDLHGAA